MNQQVLIIHGGTTFNSYDEYLRNLGSMNIDIERLRYKLDWKDSIAADLGDKFEVLMPKMPNSSFAQYDEWKIVFEEITQVIRDDVILVGHSLGGIFLAKYLSENDYPKRIKKLFLVAAPCRDLETEELASFSLPKSLDRLVSQANLIVLFHSPDDEIVTVSHSKNYQKELPNSELIIINDMGHFQIEHFPELVSQIKTI
jgi:predicted alpha/beta hydrolase family esterase